MSNGFRFLLLLLFSIALVVTTESETIQPSTYIDGAWGTVYGDILRCNTRQLRTLGASMDDDEAHTIQNDSEILRKREKKIAQIKGYGSPLAPPRNLAANSHRYFVVISHNVLCARRTFQLLATLQQHTLY